jgi:DNA helicase-2/ATP-dependent DNA helicase PcrA
VNPKDYRALESAAQAPRRGIGEKTLDLYRSAAEWKHGGDLVEALCDVPPEGVRGNKAGGMGQILRKWQWALKEEVGLSDIVERAVVESGLEAALEAEGHGRVARTALQPPGTRLGRRGLRRAQSDGGLKGFLEEVALVSDADSKDSSGKAAVLMTLHNSKGLEFDVVCLAGCEEGLFPLLRQDGGPEALEEERRLFYVGTTRARKKLHILNARVRTRFGIRDACIPSRFLDEMDLDAVVFELGSPRGGLFAGGDLESDDSPRRPLGPSGFHSQTRRPAFPPGSLRSQERQGTSTRSTSAPGMGSPSRTPSSSGAMFPDYESENQSLEGAYKQGMRVKHPKFGAGQILKIHGSGNAARLDVLFGKETKRLVASMANLSILG